MKIIRAFGVIVAAFLLTVGSAPPAAAFGFVYMGPFGCDAEGRSSASGSTATGKTDFFRSCVSRDAQVRLRAANGAVTGWTTLGGGSGYMHASITRSFSENDWVGADHRECSTCTIYHT